MCRAPGTPSIPGALNARKCIYALFSCTIRLTILKLNLLVRSYVFDAREPEVRELDPMENIVTHPEQVSRKPCRPRRWADSSLL